MPEKLYEWMLTLAVGVIAYFIQDLIKDIKEFSKKQQEIELKLVSCMDKVMNVETSSEKAMEAQAKLFESRIANIESSLNKINTTVEDTQKILIHMDKNQAVTAKSFEMIIKLEDRVEKLEHV